MSDSAAPPHRWREPEPISAELTDPVKRAVGLPRNLCELLIRRNPAHADPERARSFLRPLLTHLHAPSDLPDLLPAVERIERAISEGEPMLVHGDYDVDGMTATALLVHGLKDLGGRVSGFVPHRTRDGYDLGPAGLARAEEEGARLIITADCGTLAKSAVEEARSKGIDVVVTDHHRPGPDLPNAVAVINPSRSDSQYPFDGLAGVGVAFKLLSQLHADRGLATEYLNQHLDLVALGTVADQAPLVDENRALVRFGLRALDRTRKPGLQALLRVARRGARSVDADEIAYQLAPRLNAVGRVGAAEDGMQLLVTEEHGEADSLARHIDEQNQIRRATDRKVLQEADEQLDREYDPGRDRVVVLWRDGWHRGVLGITASRLVDRLQRPTILLGFEGESGRGSARSVEGFHLFHALEACAPALERFGGHAMAAGFDIRRSRLDEFLGLLRDYAERELPIERLTPPLEIDLALPLATITPEFYRDLSHLEPFGASNPRPRIALRRVGIRDARAIGGDGAHLKATLESDGVRLDAIGFGQGDRLSGLKAGARYDVAMELHENEWRGRVGLQAHLIDFRSVS
jgi:single-stranded-DNA-specific exonuclease